MSAFEKLGIYHFFGVFSSGKWGFETCDGMRKPIFLNTPILSATSSFDRFSNHKPQFLPDWSTIRRSSQILLDSLGSSRLHGSAASTPKGGRFKTSPHFWPDVRPTGPGIGLQTWRGAPSGWPGAVIIYRAILWLSYGYPMVIYLLFFGLWTHPWVWETLFNLVVLAQMALSEKNHGMI